MILFNINFILRKLTKIQLNKSKKKRIPKFRNIRVTALNKCPQKLGTVIKLIEQAPKKPNSAKRKVAKVKLKHTSRMLSAHIPGIGHNLTKHSTVLVRGGRCQDLIGVRYKLIRGKESLGPVDGRISRLSKYGFKKKDLFIESRNEYNRILLKLKNIYLKKLIKVGKRKQQLFFKYKLKLIKFIFKKHYIHIIK
jgi:small subunit ribosomal protein S12